MSDSELIQAGLSVRDWSLGVKHHKQVSMLTLPAFLASAASTLCIQDEILFDCECQPEIHSLTRTRHYGQQV